MSEETPPSSHGLMFPFLISDIILDMGTIFLYTVLCNATALSRFRQRSQGGRICTMVLFMRE